MCGFRRATKWHDDGWLPIHHAIQATVYWGKAIDVTIGLIEAMASSQDPPPQEDWLRAKTRGGRPKGYTPLHFAPKRLRFQLQEERAGSKAAQSPCESRRQGHRHDTGHALLEGRRKRVVQVLLQARADLYARTATLPDRRGGKSALQLAHKCSGQMARPVLV